MRALYGPQPLGEFGRGRNIGVDAIELDAVTLVCSFHCYRLRAN